MRAGSLAALAALAALLAYCLRKPASLPHRAVRVAPRPLPGPVRVILPGDATVRH